MVFFPGCKHVYSVAIERRLGRPMTNTEKSLGYRAACMVNHFDNGAKSLHSKSLIVGYLEPNKLPGGCCMRPGAIDWGTRPPGSPLRVCTPGSSARFARANFHSACHQAACGILDAVGASGETAVTLLPFFSMRSDVDQYLHWFDAENR